MKIADRPTDPRRSGRRDIEWNFDDGLSELFYHIACGGGLEERIARLERRGQLETELDAVRRDCAPEAFHQSVAFHAE